MLVSDVDPARVDGYTAVAPEDVIGTECDVYAPCAVGGTITAETVEQLRCSVVAGAANNQLAAPELADRLHERGILYAPDYVINSGGVLHGTGLELLGWDQARLDEALRGLGDTLHELYADDGRSPVHAAEALVARRAPRLRLGARRARARAAPVECPAHDGPPPWVADGRPHAVAERATQPTRTHACDTSST